MAPVGYYSFSAQGLILEANLTFATMLGVARSALINTPITRFILGDDQDLFYAYRRRLFDSGRLQVCEWRMLRAGEGSFWSRSEATVIEGADGARVGRVVMSDVSERKRAEQEQERERERARLAQELKLEALGTLAGGIAHGFNNILQGILGELSLIEVELGEERARTLELREARALVDRGGVLMRQLLGFARQGKYDVKPLNLARVVERTSEVYGRSRRDLIITLELPSNLRAVVMDHTQLEEVLANLMVNAGQAMPNGGRLLIKAEEVELTASEVGPDAAPGPYVKLLISDTGTGMDAVTQARIFEPFFTTKGQGHGLGLASVYGIIKSHGALIRVQSELGHGATFLLYLPVSAQLPAELSPRPTELQRGQGTVMIVDDEPGVLRVCGRMVEKMGYEVLSASGGRQAVDLLRQHGPRISLVILDMLMPDMNGAETFKALRELAPGLKVLLSSGYSVEGDVRELLAQGCSGLLQKPFDGATLSARLRELV